MPDIDQGRAEGQPCALLVSAGCATFPPCRGRPGHFHQVDDLGTARRQLMQMWCTSWEAHIRRISAVATDQPTIRKWPQFVVSEALWLGGQVRLCSVFTD